MTVKQGIFEIETSKGMASLYHKTLFSKKPCFLLLHGFGSDEKIWFRYPESLGNYLINLGFNIWALHLSRPLNGDIRYLAHEDLYEAIDFIYYATKRKIHIIAHSMGGIITRYLLSEHINHPFNISELLTKISGVTLLAVPNHGIKPPNFIRKLRDVIKRIDEDQMEFLQADYAMTQLLETSDLIIKLNSFKKLLNPAITWMNAIAKYDQVVDVKSANLDKGELNPKTVFEQKEFPCDHMVYPLANNQMVQKVLASFDVTLHPAIHTYTPVGQWIIEMLKLKEKN